MESWTAEIPKNRGPKIEIPTKNGKIIFFPEDKAQLLLLAVPDQEHPIRLRGDIKRIFLTLLHAAMCPGH